MNEVVIVKMEKDSGAMLNEILERQSIVTIPQDDSMYIRMRTLMISLLGLSVSLCSFNTQQCSLLDEEEDQDMNSISFGRKITKPFIIFAMGRTMFSTLVTAVCSLLLMLAVMSTETRWRHGGARWLAAPALLALAVEVCSNTADAALSVALLSTTEPGLALLHAGAAVLFIVAEFIIWYFIAKFFEHQPRSEVQDPSNKELSNVNHTDLPKTEIPLQ